MRAEGVMRSAIDVTEIREVLRDAHCAIVRVGSSPILDDDNAPRMIAIEDILRPDQQRLTRISSWRDLSKWATLEAAERLRRAHYGPPPGYVHPTWQLLTGILADNLLSSTMDFDMTPWLADFVAQRREKLAAAIGSDAVILVESDLQSGNSRAALLDLAPLVLQEDGRTTASKLGIKLSKRAPRIDPTWSKSFQRPDRPIQFWFDETTDGSSLFVVYYTAKCTWLKCPWCTLPNLSSEARVGPIDLFSQTDFVLERSITAEERKRARSITLSNNGSILAGKTFSPDALGYAMHRASQFLPNLRTVVLETRVEYVTVEALQSVRRSLDEIDRSIDYEVAVGVEAFDDDIRNKVLKKGLSLAAIDRAAHALAENKGALRAYFMMKPVASMSDDAAVDDVARGLAYLETVAEKHKVPVTMHLNPTYAAVGTVLEKDFREGRFTPPRLERLVEFLKSANARRVRIHLGLNDEGLAVEGGSFLRPESAEALRSLRRYNRTGKLD